MSKEKKRGREGRQVETKGNRGIPHRWVEMMSQSESEKNKRV